MARLFEVLDRNDGDALHPNPLKVLRSRETLSSSPLESVRGRLDHSNTQSIPHSHAPGITSHLSPDTPSRKVDLSCSQQCAGPTDDSENGEHSAQEGAIEEEYDEKVIVSQAEAAFEMTGELPDFVVRHGGLWQQPVRIEDNEAGEIIFRTWGDEGLGYWVMEDEGVFKVVKYFDQEDEYRIFLGGHENYSESPIAWPLYSKSKSEKGTQQMISRADGTKSEPDMKSRRLRDRKSTQLKPYTVDKIRHTRQKAGKVTKTSNVESALPSDTRHKRMKRRSTDSTDNVMPHEKRRLSQSSWPEAGFANSASRSTSIALPDDMLSKTVLYTRLEIESTPTALFLNGTPEGFFEKVDAAWSLDAQPYDLILTLPWKKQFEQMKLRRQLGDTWQNLLEDIRLAPCWKLGNKCEIDAVIRLDERSKSVTTS